MATTTHQNKSIWISYYILFYRYMQNRYTYSCLGVCMSILNYLAIGRQWKQYNCSDILIKLIKCAHVNAWNCCSEFIRKSYNWLMHRLHPKDWNTHELIYILRSYFNCAIFLFVYYYQTFFLQYWLCSAYSNRSDVF